MDLEVRQKLAALLRSAAAQTIPEKDFWSEFESLVDPVREPVAGLAYECATHFWGDFHARNLFLIRVKPDRYQLSQGRTELNLIADGLDGDWALSDLKRKLSDV